MRALMKKIIRTINIAFLAGGVAIATMRPNVLADTEIGNGGNANFNIPVHSARFSRQKPIIAVVAENSFTELTDYVIPFGVLSASGVASVYALATRQGPVQLFPALKVQPQATTAQFDGRFPEGADFVIVPAVHEVDDASALTHSEGAGSRASLARMVSAGLVHTKGLDALLCSRM